MKNLCLVGLALAQVTSVAIAGNEAGGSWVVNRVRGRALLAVSELCRYPQEARGISDVDLRKLETLVTGSAMQGVTEEESAQRGLDWRRQPFLIVDKTIQLRKKSWEYWFDHNVDVYAEALVPFLTLLGDAHPVDTANVINLSGLATNGYFTFDRNDPAKGMPTFRNGGVAWKTLPGRFTFEQAQERCRKLNTSSSTASLAHWEVATSAHALAAAATLTAKYLDVAPYKRPSSYRVWTTDGNVADLIEARADAAGEDQAGALCEGQ